MDEERLVVALEARIRDFEKNMQKAERRGTQSYSSLRRGSQTATTAMERDMLRSTSRINQALASTSTQIGAFGRAFLAGALATGIAAITTGAARAVRGIADIDREAKRAGLSLKAFQELKFVGDQNRIEIDAMIDGFKELQLRADEWITTGAGPGEEAFRRLGYSATDLKRRLEEPEELFLDIVNRMEDLDRAAQIRVADEVFGGTAGERFVELLEQGDEGLRQTMQRAHEVGAVLDAEMIEKAQDIDRRFNDLATRVSSFGKRVAVEFADAAVEAVDLRAKLDELFPNEGQGRAVLGDEAFEALEDNRDAVDAAAVDIGELREQYVGLAEDADRTANALTQAANLARAWGYEEVAATLADSATEMRNLSDQFKDGTIDGEAFGDQLSTIQTNASAAFDELSEADKVDFSNAISEVSRLGSMISEVARLAVEMGNRIRDAAGLGAAGPGMDQIPSGPLDVSLPPSGLAPGSSPRPQMPSVNFGPDTSPRSTNATSGGGGGGGDKRSDFEKEVERTRAAIAQLEAESVALLAVAEGGREMGTAVEYARKKAELLYDAQSAGLNLTPELRAQIEELASGYATAGSAAEAAADRLREVQQSAELGADRMADFFSGILDGSMSAEDALKGLVQELLRAQLRSSFLNLADGGGSGSSIFSAIGTILSGGRATGGPVRAGSAYLVNERTANSEVFVPSRSGGVLNVPQAQAALRQSAAPVAAPAPVVNVPVTVQREPGTNAEVRRRGDGSVDIRVMIERTIDDYFASGKADRTMGHAYGLRGRPRGY
ncbi:hypothetical protein [Salipiger sp. PrR003]|uniref:hypothetical protein n=1 Tax=Salipiger sp. PrR003 TaxID=2706776 RepID=UPI0013D98037|nr:hypothetical protein [Salipiger sp. PrR003]NDV52160.1 hypothetical protein [Salipiger sp. PrR003]NDV52186.1 hypothetical protein [Salipiger sp. PrR003]